MVANDLVKGMEKEGWRRKDGGRETDSRMGFKVKPEKFFPGNSLPFLGRMKIIRVKGVREKKKEAL